MSAAASIAGYMKTKVFGERLIGAIPCITTGRAPSSTMANISTWPRVAPG